MKKTILCIIFLFAYIFSIPAQTLYGTTFYGGNNGGGTINKFTPVTNDLTVTKSFESFAANPYNSNLIEASDGIFYGMTFQGGSAGGGVIFSFDPSSSTYTKLKDLDQINGYFPTGSLIQANDGKLYGMTFFGGYYNTGVIFSFDPASYTYTKLMDFDNNNYPSSNVNGSSPNGSLIQAADGKLYGMTTQGGSSNVGVIFSFDLSASTYTKLKDFDSTNGAFPTGSLNQAKNGKLYGLTTAGGSTNLGVIFSFDPASSTYTKLKDFDNVNGANPFGTLIQAKNGKLYGMTVGGGTLGHGVIFSFKPSSSTYTKEQDFDGAQGANPYGSLIQASDGKLYGVTNGGGSSGLGVIFSFKPSSSTYIKLKDFAGAEGANPYGTLMQASDGKLYGMTLVGGIHNFGVIFSFNPTFSTYTKVNDFATNKSGSYPSGSLMRASNGQLYGMTTSGGSSNAGVIFSFDPYSSTYIKLMDFDSINGANPYGSLIQGKNGKLYGLTTRGGSTNAGVIFSFDPYSSTYVKLMDFDYINGANPYGSLNEARNGKLYGMTTGGGANGYGVIFSIDITSFAYTKLKDLDYTNGANPYGSLIQAKNGKLYGMTTGGGSAAIDRDGHGGGVLFSFDPTTATYTKLKDFDTNGYYPYGSLIQAKNGQLYGMTSQGGGGDLGVIFSFEPSSSTYTKLNDFGNNGHSPYGSLMQASDGKLYGMTMQGGSNNLGVIFSFDASSSIYANLKDFDNVNGANPYIGSAFIKVPVKNKDLVKSTSDLYGNFVVANPNPFSDRLAITVESPIQNQATITLTDISGRQMFIENKLLSPGTNAIQLKEVSKLTKGIYVLTVIQSQTTQSIKVVKGN